MGYLISRAMIFNEQKKSYTVLVLFFLVILIFIIGAIVLYSATSHDSYFSSYFLKQLFGFLGGAILFYFISFIFYRKMILWGMIFHFFVLALLVFTLIKGSFVMGGKRWISLYFFKFQPSELAKISLSLSLVHYMYYFIDKKIFYYNWLVMFLNIFLTGLLIMKQPDLGTALIVIISSIGVLFASGLPRKIIFFGFFFILISFPLIWGRLYDYQKKRVLVFLGYGSPQQERYQLEQSKIAIGSGGLYGKGFLLGTQKNLNFLPENRTDFIFSVLGEEFGFFGSLSLLLLYLFLFIIFFLKSLYILDFYGYLLYLGMILPFMLGVVFNLGMVVGLFPVVGIPLPFMSYGLTHIISTSIMLGIAASVIRFSRD